MLMLDKHNNECLIVIIHKFSDWFCFCHEAVIEEEKTHLEELGGRRMEGGSLEGGWKEGGIGLGHA